jgi:hypothetical protein
MLMAQMVSTEMTVVAMTLVARTHQAPIRQRALVAAREQWGAMVSQAAAVMVVMVEWVSQTRFQA